MGALFGGLGCVDPANHADESRAQGWPVGDWQGRANSFDWSAGRDPGRGCVLMTLSDLASLDVESALDLTFADSAGRTVTLKSLYVTDAHDTRANSARGDPRAVYRVELTDRRGVSDDGPVLDIAYNLRDQDGDYVASSLNAGVAWTWSELLQDLWDANGLMGSLPTLPGTPDGTPEGFEFYGVGSYDAINDVLDRLGWLLVLDLQADVFKIVSEAEANVTATTVLANIDGERVLDSDPLIPARSVGVETVKVFFPARRDGSLPAIPFYSLAVATGLVGASPDSEVALHDDLVALYDAAGTLTNASDLAARADERAADYSRRCRQVRRRRIYSGVVAELSPCSTLPRIVYRDAGSGRVTTELLAGPGEGPTRTHLTGGPTPALPTTPGAEGGAGGPAGPGGGLGLSRSLPLLRR